MKEEAPSNVQSFKQAKLYKAHFPNEVGKDNHKTWIESEVRWNSNCLDKAISSTGTLTSAALQPGNFPCNK